VVRLRPGAIRGLNLLLVFALLRGFNFFQGSAGFLPSQKPKHSKFQFDQDRGPAWKLAKSDVASALNNVNIINLFIYPTELP